MSMKETFQHDLVVVENFLGYVKGEIIKDAAQIKQVIESEWSAHVHRVDKTPEVQPQKQ